MPAVMRCLEIILKILLQLPILVTQSTKLTLPPSLRVKIFLVGGGGSGGFMGGEGSGQLVESWVQVPASGKLILTIGLGGEVEGEWSFGDRGDTIVLGEGEAITAAGGVSGVWGCAGWSGGGGRGGDGGSNGGPGVGEVSGSGSGESEAIPPIPNLRPTAGREGEGLTEGLAGTVEGDFGGLGGAGAGLSSSPEAQPGLMPGTGRGWEREVAEVEGGAGATTAVS